MTGRLGGLVTSYDQLTFELEEIISSVNETVHEYYIQHILAPCISFERLGSVVGFVIQATGRMEFENGLKALIQSEARDSLESA